MSGPHTRELNGNLCMCICVCVCVCVSVRSGTCSNKSFYQNSSKFLFLYVITFLWILGDQLEERSDLWIVLEKTGSAGENVKEFVFVELLKLTPEERKDAKCTQTK